MARGFTDPRGFKGTHGFEIPPQGPAAVTLRHELEMELAGLALLTWPVFYRPLHDALIEDSLEKGEHELFGRVERPRQWTRYVKLLRWGATALRRRYRGDAAAEPTAHVT